MRVEIALIIVNFTQGLSCQKELGDQGETLWPKTRQEVSHMYIYIYINVKKLPV